MIKVFIQQDDNKFVNNALMSKYSNIQLYSTQTTNSLYELFYKIEFDVCIFMAHKFDKEIYQFIKEFANGKVRIFIYHSLVQSSLLDLQYSNLTHLIETNQLQYKKNKNVIILPTLVNKELFAKNNAAKLDVISCFLDNVTDIPEALLKKLYPNTKLPIKLFNNPHIKHHQNLGMLTEKDKAFILSKSEYYLSIGGHYSAEAALSGCKVIDISELDDMKVGRYKHQKPTQTYSQYIEKLLCN